MCASPLSPRHAQPDWMGGGLVSRQMMHAIFAQASLLGLDRRRPTKVSILSPRAGTGRNDWDHWWHLRYRHEPSRWESPGRMEPSRLDS